MLATDGSWHIGPRTEPCLCPRAETTRPIRRRRPAPRTHGGNQSLLHIQYFELATEADTDAYLAQFADDAVVEDEGKAQHGIAEIAALSVRVRSRRTDRGPAHPPMIRFTHQGAWRSADLREGWCGWAAHDIGL